MLYTDSPLPYKYGVYFDKNNRFTCFQLLLHLRIQADPIRQRVLYDTAMSLWR